MSQHKRGDTFDVSGQIDVTLQGSPVLDLTGWTGASQIRTTSGALIADLTFSWLNPAQRLMRLRATNSSGWMLGTHEIDVQLTSPAGDVVSTSTATIEIVRDVTRPE